MNKPMEFNVEDFSIELVYNMETKKPMAIEIGISDMHDDKYSSMRLKNEDVLKLANWLNVYVETYLR